MSFYLLQVQPDTKQVINSLVLAEPVSIDVCVKNNLVIADVLTYNDYVKNKEFFMYTVVIEGDSATVKEVIKEERLDVIINHALSYINLLGSEYISNAGFTWRQAKFKCSLTDQQNYTRLLNVYRETNITNTPLNISIKSIDGQIHTLVSYAEYIDFYRTMSQHIEHNLARIRQFKYEVKKCLNGADVVSVKEKAERSFEV